jgi:hypothetical protein
LRLVKPILEVHPMADLFPMLSDEELEVLADDIKENGQQVPCVLDSQGRLIDGRNRLKACELAGVEPRFETYDGDPGDYVISANVNRRHLSAGQRAMAVAMVKPEAKRGGARTRGSSSETLLEFSKVRLSQARKVLQFNPEMAKAVLAGAVKLDKALEEAQAAETRANSVEGKWAKLRREAPDLADLVTEERLGLDEAIGSLGEREKQKRVAIEHGEQAVHRLRAFGTHVSTLLAAMSLGRSDLLDEETIRQVKSGYATFLKVIEKFGQSSSNGGERQ